MKPFPEIRYIHESHCPLTHHLLLTPLVALSAPIAFKLQTKPKIMLIFADDLGNGDLGCAGAKEIKTPNTDRLAAEGGWFTQGSLTNIGAEPTGLERPDPDPRKRHPRHEDYRRRAF